MPSPAQVVLRISIKPPKLYSSSFSLLFLLLYFISSSVSFFDQQLRSFDAGFSVSLLVSLASALKRRLASHPATKTAPRLCLGARDIRHKAIVSPARFFDKGRNK